MLRSRHTTTAPPPVASPLRLCAVLLIAVALAAQACSKPFQPRKFPTTMDLFRASTQEYQKHHWDNALAGFDLLAQQLPARDTLLADVYWYQGQTHERKDEHLLAAQAYSRIIDAFPDDSIADDALLRTGTEYEAMWRKPMLDAQYGQTALATYRQLLSLYPDSKLVPEAGKRIASLNARFAKKDFDTGDYYYRRKAWDSAIIYFRDVTRLYPGTPSAKLSYLRLLAAFRAINYKEDVTETCAEARKFYPTDDEVSRACASVPNALANDTARAATDSTRPRAPIPPR
jgi:outer membrane protein assembly factor BamD